MADAATLPELSHDEIRRYSRHLILDDVGVTGQRRLKASKVLCIGCGGLGSPVLMYLAAGNLNPNPNPDRTGPDPDPEPEPHAEND